jgi:hypothetical protein
LGLDFTDAHGAILPVTQIAQQLQNRLKGLSQEQRIAAMNTVFGSDATRAATILMNEGSKGLAKYIKATSDRAAAEKLAKTNTEGAAGAFERLSGAVETTQIRLGSALLPTLADAATFMADRVLPAVEKTARQFGAALVPELGRVRLAWEQNESAIWGFVTSLASSDGQVSNTREAARSLADALEKLIQLSGQAAEKSTTLGNWLNWLAKQASDEGGAADKLGDMLAQVLGLKREMGPTADDTQTLATNTGAATTAADRHAAAVRGEAAAVRDLKSALDVEHKADLDVRQGKLDLSRAQARLTELRKTGKTKTFEYKQAQLDLEYAQNRLKDAQGRLRQATVKATEAERVAASVSTRAADAHKVFGRNAYDAGRMGRKFGDMVRDGLLRIPKGRTIVVSAKARLDAQRLYFSTSSAAIRERAQKGLRIPGYGGGDRVPILAEAGETVVPKEAAREPDFQAWAAAKKIPGYRHGGGVGRYADGGTIPRGGVGLNFRSSGVAAFRRGLQGFQQNLIQALVSAAKWDLTRAFKAGGGNPAIKAFIRSTDPLPYKWGAAGPGAYDCSGLVSAVLGKVTGRGGGHGQRYFTTSTIHSGILGIKPGLGGVLQIGVTASTGHMAGRYGGLGFEAESTRTGIKTGSAASRPESFARHFHLSRGGRIDDELLARFARLMNADIGGDEGRLRVNGKVLDRGGWLQPREVGVNLGNRPERVVAPREVLTVTLDPASARMVAEHVVRGLHSTPIIVSIDGNQVRTAVRNAQRRAGYPANQQVR